MRITIVDTTTMLVSQVVELLWHDESSSECLSWLIRDYSHSSFKWFVTVLGEMPRHVDMNRHGQILRDGQPSTQWSIV